MKNLPIPEIPSYATCKMFWLILKIHRFLHWGVVRRGIEAEGMGYSTSREVSQTSHAAADAH
jgi:hypothetical protein